MDIDRLCATMAKRITPDSYQLVQYKYLYLQNTSAVQIQCSHYNVNSTLKGLQLKQFLSLFLLILELIHFSFQKRVYYQDRKSTRLNSSHVSISYAVFCLKKKNCK